MKSIICAMLFVLANIAVSKDFYNCNEVDNLQLKDLAQISAQPLKVGDAIKTKIAQPFDVTKYQGKTLVFLVSATWCGYCKYDLLKTGEWRKKKGWPKDDVAVVHMLVSSGKQDLKTAEAFIKNPSMRKQKLSLDGVDYYFSGATDFNGIKVMKGKAEKLLFPGIQGTPYAIIFDKKGVPRFRGHYTGRYDDHNKYYDEHYKFIGEVAKGKCK